MKKLNLLLSAFIILGVQSFFAQTYTISTIAGTGVNGYNGDNLPATAAQLYNPVGITLDTIGNLYITEWKNNRVRKIDTSGNISTVVGLGTAGYNGDNIYAVSAQLKGPTDVTFDKQGNMYIADGGNNRIRKVDKNGIITTIAGNGISGYSGDNGAATIAQLNNPYNVKTDNLGNVFIAEWQNNCIRKVSNLGVISTIAGTGVLGFSGDGGFATVAQLSKPMSVAFDNSGNLFITDRSNYKIRKITSGIITTIAGMNTSGYSGDNGPAIEAELESPIGIALDIWGNIYFSDNFSNVIRKIDNSGKITTIAGNGTEGFSGDNGPATSANLNTPGHLIVDKLGNIYFTDELNHRVRKLTPSNLNTENQSKIFYKLYPNPVNHELTIESDVNMESIAIYDAVGRLMQNVQPLLGVVKIDISSHTNGTYFITMKTKSGEVYREKIIKQ